MSNRNDRSDAALHERLKIAGKATKGLWKKSFRDFECEDGFGWESKPIVEAQGKIVCLFYDREAEIDDVDNDEDDAAHIAASSPDVVRADIEEILRLRTENEQLALENQRLAVDGVNGEAYLLTCLDIIRRAVGMPVGSDWQQVAERVELLGKEADWLANAAENGGCLSGEVCPRCPNGHHERKRCYGRDMRLAAHDAVMKKRRKSCKN